MGTITPATGKIELWVVFAVQALSFGWYQYLHFSHADSLNDWYFTEVAKKNMAEEPTEEESLEDELGGLAEAGIGGGADEF